MQEEQQPVKSEQPQNGMALQNPAAVGEHRPEVLLFWTISKHLLHGQCDVEQGAGSAAMSHDSEDSPFPKH